MATSERTQRTCHGSRCWISEEDAMEHEFYLIKTSDGTYYNGSGFKLMRESAPKLYMGWKAAMSDIGVLRGRCASDFTLKPVVATLKTYEEGR